MGNEFGKAVHERRVAYGYTQDALSELLDITPQYLGKIETGINFPSLKLLITLAKTLDLSLDALLLPVSEHGSIIREITVMLNNSTEAELIVLKETLRSLLTSLRKAYGSDDQQK